MDIQKIWENSVAFHGHKCGGLALGVRAAMEAQKRFGIERADDEEVVCITENDACGVDGIQYVLGCTLGKGNLLYHRSGKFAFNFFDRRSGDSFRLMAKDKKEGLHGQEYIDFVLCGPLEEIFEIGKPHMEVPEKTKSLKSLKCDTCGETAPENKMRLMNGKAVCLDCYQDYNRGW